MRLAVRLLIFFAVSTILFACNGKGGDQPQRSKEEQKTVSDNDRNLALKFLHGVQDGDKNRMYDAANLTRDLVNESREKLIHQAKNKPTDQQRLDLEHALRISGNIDFFVAKIRTIMPKSASFQITQTTGKDVTDGVKKTDHSVKVTYSNKEESMRDKTGKPVKELVLHLLQISRSINGHWIHDFSFDSKDFEKIADRDFEVLSYF